MKILINKGNKYNAKSYPYWDDFVKLAQEHEIKYITGIMTIEEIRALVEWSDAWITIDTFLQHFCAYFKLKRGIVLWGKSDPNLFGYPHNINLLKDRKYLRINQFRDWTREHNDIENNPESFVSPETLLNALSMV